MSKRFAVKETARPAMAGITGSGRHGSVRPAALALVFGCILAGGAADARAQSVAASDIDMGSIERRIELIEPRSGPPGTVVRVNTEDMPVITPIRVGIGAAQAGFEAFQELMTGDEGDFDVTVAVPEWASWERVHVFIVFDIYFRPIALSDAFHVTNGEGLIRRTGRVRDGDDGCRLFRDIDGVQYALTGVGTDVEVSALPENTTVTLEGRVGEREVCGLRNVIEVLRARTQ